MGTFLGKEQLVDDDVVCVNLVLCKFLHEPLGLVQREKFGDAHADERRAFLDGAQTGISGEKGIGTVWRHTGSLNCTLTSVMMARIDSSLANMSSWEPMSPPIMEDI
jgi:hypothetical protein